MRYLFFIAGMLTAAAVLLLVAPERVPLAAAQAGWLAPDASYEPVTIILKGTMLTFAGACRAISMEIIDAQALSIHNGLERTIDARPLTHDLIMDIFTAFGITPEHVRLESYKNNIYYATLVARRDNRLVEFDVRPSDAAGIAVRGGLPVYATKALLDEKGAATC